MDQPTAAPTREQVEAAVTETLVGWGAELDTDRKFWWADWRRLIDDVITAIRSGEAVVYEDDGPERSSDADGSPTR